MILSLFHKKYQQKFQKKKIQSIIPNKYSCFLSFQYLPVFHQLFRSDGWIKKAGERG